MSDVKRRCAAVARAYRHKRGVFAANLWRWGMAAHPHVLRLFPRGSKWRRAVVRFNNRKKKEAKS